ncbi:unnamed protein product [Paramecium octaurelia]|uniref:Uncharacterized protein n=1 Tax=Paramecium octaurelia TaxID=43137 RepID=A0A8S1Y607_PAROT|nr:unnamed protein product [Paramecium octaurelia]
MLLNILFSVRIFRQPHFLFRKVCRGLLYRGCDLKAEYRTAFKHFYMVWLHISNYRQARSERNQINRLQILFS